MACDDLVAQSFFDERAPLAASELDRERALKYLECCYQHGMSWWDAKQQILDCLQQRGVLHQGIVRQLALAKPLPQPWLGWYTPDTISRCFEERQEPVRYQVSSWFAVICPGGSAEQHADL